MNILFKRGDHKHADMWDRIIMAATGGPWVHTELEFSDGRCFSSQAPAGVHLLDSIDTTDKSVWEVVTLPWSETAALVAWAESIIGLPYDYVGAISSGIGLAVQLAGRWFCSESSIEGMSRAGAFGIPPLLCPMALHCYLTSMLRGDEVEDLQLHAQQHYATRAKQVAQVEWATSHEESIVQGWQVQLRQGRPQVDLAKDIERWYNASQQEVYGARA
jgi:hypothetical protein